MPDTFHAGELAVQARVGQHSGAVVHRSIPEIAAEFLVTRPAVVLAGRDGDGRVWTTLLTGPPGFMQAPDPRVMVVNARPLPGDPLADLVAHGGEVGSILWDHHGRMRVNGPLEPRPGGFAIATVQVYSNCGRYIARRHPLDPSEVVVDGPDEAVDREDWGAELSADQVDLVRRADTFFIGTAHPGGAADASHRGGNPGFVLVDSPRTLRWPDYNGNAMFMTLGNLAVDPRAGLLFVDWATGTSLQVTGRARVDWDPAAAAALPGAERVVELTVDAVHEVTPAHPTRWSPAVLSRYNPAPTPA